MKSLPATSTLPSELPAENIRLALGGAPARVMRAAGDDRLLEFGRAVSLGQWRQVRAGTHSIDQQGEGTAPQFRIAVFLGDRAEHQLEGGEVQHNDVWPQPTLFLRPRDELIEHRRDSLVHLRLALGTPA